MIALATKLWWMIHKDLLSEYRTRQVWPTMMLLGTVVVFVFSMQMNLPAIERQRVVGGMLWLAVFFAGIVALDRSFAGEREGGCLAALLGYPVSASAVYLAKLVVNVMALTCLECVLIPLFVVLSGLPLLASPGTLALIVVLGNLGIAAVGTLLSAMTSGMRHGTGLLAILLLPLVVPVLLSAAEATRLTIAGEFGADWQRWLQLLGAFAVVFVTAGTVLFEFVVQE